MSWKSLAMRPLLDAAGRARMRGFRRVHRRILDDVPDVPDALDRVGRRWELPVGTEDQPIFLLAAGWRSGSTAVQRLIMSGGALIWGEPYARCSYVQQMSEGLRALGADYPREEYLLANRDGDLTAQWVANLFPGMEDVKAAHRSFFDRMLSAPASERGYSRWGLKEVRLGADHAHYLRWLYPDARFVFLVRAPLAAYRSYLRAGPSFARWPEDAVITPGEFGRHWARLTTSFVDHARSLDGLLLRFEDLFDPTLQKVAELSDYLGMPLRRRVLDRPIAGSGQVGARVSVPRIDRRAVVAETEDVAPRLGYRATPDAP